MEVNTVFFCCVRVLRRLYALIIIYLTVLAENRIFEVH
jgi:hypothetical protein